METAEQPNLTFESVCENPPDSELPPLDREDPGPDVELNDEMQFWRDNGYLILPKLFPDSLTDAYISHCLASGKYPSGWVEPCAFTHEPPMRDLLCYQPLMDKIEMLISTPMVLNLALTGWWSSDRTWHQDDYLNPPYINCWYAAVWIALDDISPTSGVFEYVPGSHKWPLMRGEKIRENLPEDVRNQHNWPEKAEELVTPLFDQKIKESGLPIKQFLAKKGDVLIWHGRLAHRGTIAQKKLEIRRSLIAHYSALTKRHHEFPRLKRHKNQGWYFLLGDSVSK